jgi:hypothetical protein
VFPVSVTAGSYRRGKGNEGIVEVKFELVTAAVVADQALLGKFGQGIADGGSAQAGQLAKALDGDGFLLVSQETAHALSDRFGRRFSGSGGGDHGQGESGAGLGQMQRDVILGGSGAMFGGQG